MSNANPDAAPAELRALVDERQIREIVHRYCRGIDRCDFDLVRSCYHPDAVDDHGTFVGTVDEFVAYVEHGLQQFTQTMHFVGNVMIELDGDRARVESYTTAHHHLPASRSKPEREFTVRLRYLDDFERRDGDWRIARRVCVFEWGRVDSPDLGWWRPEPPSAIGARDPSDLVYAPSLVR